MGRKFNRVRALLMMLILTFSVILTPFISASSVGAAEIQATGLSANDAKVAYTATDGTEADYTNKKFSEQLKAKVSYNFAIPDGVQLNAGDTATFEIPSNVKITDNDAITFNITGVDDPNTIVATGTTIEGSNKGIITFTDALKDTLFGRKGTLEFTATGTEKQTGTGSVADYVVVKAGWISHHEEGTNKPDTLGWQVGYNYKNEPIDNVTVTDQIGQYHHLKETVSTSDAADADLFNAHHGVKVTYADTGEVLPNYSVEVSADQQTITVKIPHIDRRIEVAYYTTITDWAKGSWYNHAAVTGTNSENGRGADGESSENNGEDSRTVTWGGSGALDGKDGTVTLTKSSASDKNHLLDGAQYSLYRADGTLIKSGLITGHDNDGDSVLDGVGVIKYVDLTSGSYYFVETNAPEGFKLDSKHLTFTINDDNPSAAISAQDQAIELTTITGTKTWNDQDNQDGLRPSEIKVNLLADGKLVQSQTVTAANNWQYTFSNLPKTSATGQAINYTVTEDAVANYSTAVNGYDLTNSYTPGKTSVTVTKAWNDQNNQDGIRPSEVLVQLYANGERAGEAVKLSAENNWTYTWADLALKRAGQTVKYTVNEVSVPAGYTASVSEQNGNIIITNSHTPTEGIVPPTPENHEPPKPNTPEHHEPPTPNQPHNPKAPKPNTPKTHQTPKQNESRSNHRLPSTGEQIDLWLLLAGGGLLMLANALLARKKTNEE